MAQARNSDAHRMFTQRLRDEPSFSQSFIGSASTIGLESFLETSSKKTNNNRNKLFSTISSGNTQKIILPNELSIFQVEPADFPFTNIPNGSWLFLGKQKNESYDHLVNNDANFQLTITKISFLDGSVHFIRRNIRELASADEELELFPITQNLNLIFSNKSAPLLISTRTLELLGEIDLKLAREGDWRLLLSSVAVDWFSSLLYFVIYFPSQKVIQLVEWDPQSGISRSLDFLTLAQRPLLDFHHFAVSLSFSPSLITLTVYSTALDDSRSDLYVFPINKSKLLKTNRIDNTEPIKVPGVGAVSEVMTLTNDKNGTEVKLLITQSKKFQPKRIITHPPGGTVNFPVSDPSRKGDNHIQAVKLSLPSRTLSYQYSFFRQPGCIGSLNTTSDNFKDVVYTSMGVWPELIEAPVFETPAILFTATQEEAGSRVYKFPQNAWVSGTTYVSVDPSSNAKDVILAAVTKQVDGDIVEELNIFSRKNFNDGPAFVIRTNLGPSFEFGLSSPRGVWSQLKSNYFI